MIPPGQLASSCPDVAHQQELIFSKVALKWDEEKFSGAALID
ncbi:MAG TPA: hypothetical protein VK184_26310 [Nostocaceae cyanobacterium]|nr:hypothetical protein [Nostocaceae cyanobacterium]